MVAEVRSLAREFLGLMHRRRPREFDRWLERLSECGAPEMRSFAKSLRNDLAAVRAAFDVADAATSMNLATLHEPPDRRAANCVGPATLVLQEASSCFAISASHKVRKTHSCFLLRAPTDRSSVLPRTRARGAKGAANWHDGESTGALP